MKKAFIYALYFFGTIEINLKMLLLKEVSGKFLIFDGMTIRDWYRVNNIHDAEITSLFNTSQIITIINKDISIDRVHFHVIG